ncbi:MAG: helix-turn-helix transcriptional regulator [Acidimicrobiia bacterium]
MTSGTDILTVRASAQTGFLREALELADRLAEILGQGRSVPDGAKKLVVEIRDAVRSALDEHSGRWSSRDTALFSAVEDLERQYLVGPSLRDVSLSCNGLRTALDDALADRYVDEAPFEDLFEWLYKTLQVSQTDLAKMIDVSDETIARWLSGRTGKPEPANLMRVQQLAYLIQQLRHILTPLGAFNWLTAPKKSLGEISPIEYLRTSPEAFGVVAELAASLRAQPST